MQRCSWLAFAVVAHIGATAQSVDDSATYRMHWLVDGPVFVGTAAAAMGGAITMKNQDRLSEQVILSLDPSSIPTFDRRSLHIDLGENLEARFRSDVVLGCSVLAPFLLSLDKRVRREWQPLLLLYTQALLVNTSVQSWTAITADRYRPITYIPEATLSQRTDPANHNSFFSGHTSTTATATFFMARIMDDLHPELKGKRWLLYAGAAVPPALAGWYRIRAGKHFPSDVLSGLAFGAAVGLLVPEFHRATRTENLSYLPWVSPQGAGIAASWTW